MLLINAKELISTSFKPATIEGRINYRVIQQGKSKANFKEYWFKLTGNLLFYFSLNSYGGIKGNEPVGVMVMEDMTVSLDEAGEAIFAFIVIYSCKPEVKHVFSCLSLSNTHQWITALRQASFEHLRIQVKILENKLESLGGKSIFSWKVNPQSRHVLPVAPPRKAVGPKTSTFVSHSSLNEPSIEVLSKSTEPTEDLIKW